MCGGINAQIFRPRSPETVEGDIGVEDISWSGLKSRGEIDKYRGTEETPERLIEKGWVEGREFFKTERTKLLWNF